MRRDHDDEVDEDDGGKCDTKWVRTPSTIRFVYIEGVPPQT